MVELPWQRADRDIKRVERDLSLLLDELREQLSKLESEMDNDTAEISTMVELLRKMMKDVDTDLEKVKHSVGYNEARIVNIEGDILDRLTSSTHLSDQPSFPFPGINSSSSSLCDDDEFPAFSKMSQIRLAAKAIMAYLKNHCIDLVLYTIIVSMCASGMTYLYMTY
jgi:hypothetical protein